MDQMVFNFLFVYLEVNIICIILCGIILTMVSSDLRNIREVNSFRAMTIVYIFMLVIDCITQLTFRQVVTIDPLLLGIIYALHMSGFGLMAFFWLQLMELEIDSRVARSKTFWIIFLIPLMVHLILTFSSIKTGILFKINEEGVFERGPYFSIQMFISYFYFVVAALHAFIEAQNEVSPFRKKALYQIASYIVIPSIGGILQIIFSNGVPVVAPSIAICIFFIFVNIQRGQIHHDALTGLDNRKSLDQHLADKIAKTTEDMPFYLYMIDVDGFKKINDIHGHQTGDRILCLIAEALKSPKIKCERFVARYGGDEFVVIVDTLPEGVSSPGDCTDKVNEILKDMLDQKGIGIPVRITAGYAKCTSNLVDPILLIEEADRMLYKNKRER